MVNTIDSPDDEHRGARNMYRIGTNIYEKRIVRQFLLFTRINTSKPNSVFSAAVTN